MVFDVCVPTFDQATFSHGRRSGAWGENILLAVVITPRGPENPQPNDARAGMAQNQVAEAEALARSFGCSDRVVRQASRVSADG